jgi:topoisomerase (DNA) II binding protein 1
MQDVRDHPIFSPLRCRIPFPGFEKFRFCVSLSQYEEKETGHSEELVLSL